MIRTSSSLRELPLQVTLERAASIAASVGVSRVTEITRLDRIGVPVCVSIRPDAARHSVCVSAGKGLLLDEARVGAYMEAIELAWAEYNRASLTLVSVCGGDLDVPVQDYCPIWGSTIDRAAPLLCVKARELSSDRDVLVPAETVLHPLPIELGGARYYGTGTNGLASGNSILEATVHALAEVIERDNISYHHVAPRGQTIDNATLPAVIAPIVARIEELGLDLIVRFLPNRFGLPAFSAIVFDPQQPETASPGDGLHPCREIALVRALCESIQCRLSLIHGGRDDLTGVHRLRDGLSADDIERISRANLERLRGTEPARSYAAVPDLSGAATDLESTLSLLIDALAREGISHIARVVYTPPDYPVHVVRVVVPQLELHSPETRRVGPRLLAMIRG